MLLVRKKAPFHSLAITRDQPRGVSQDRFTFIYMSYKGFGQNICSTLGQAKLFVQTYCLVSQKVQAGVKFNIGIGSNIPAGSACAGLQADEVVKGYRYCPMSIHFFSVSNFFSLFHCNLVIPHTEFANMQTYRYLSVYPHRYRSLKIYPRGRQANIRAGRRSNNSATLHAFPYTYLRLVPMLDNCSMHQQQRR